MHAARRINLASDSYLVNHRPSTLPLMNDPNMPCEYLVKEADTSKASTGYMPDGT